MPSSSIQWFLYDENQAQLKVSFVHGGVYQYSNVPQFTFENLRQAPSKGRFFHQHIRNQYHYLKMNRRAVGVLKRIGI